jgi:hypothetical protein
MVALEAWTSNLEGIWFCFFVKKVAVTSFVEPRSSMLRPTRGKSNIGSSWVQKSSEHVICLFIRFLKAA